MIGGWVIHARPVTTSQWLAAGVMFAGCSVFGIADKMSSPKFDLIGVALIVASLVGGSVYGNVQQRAIQRNNGKSAIEQKDDLMFFQYIIGAFLCLCICSATGELGQGIEFLREATTLQLVNMGFFLLSLSIGLSPLLTLIQRYDATAATVSLESISCCASLYVCVCVCF